MTTNLRPSPFIIGLPGPEVDSTTEDLIRALKPAGFILFRRNCKSASQVRDLTAAMAQLSPFDPPLVFIDQEGGRINRIDWFDYMGPTGANLGDIYARNADDGVEAARLNGFIVAAQLADLGVTVNCLPVADVAFPETHDVIGDRAFSSNPAAVAVLAGAAMSGLLAGGVWPVIKHAPGHGRAMADSHHELPVVAASAEDLRATDFVPFQRNAVAPFIMTAHVLYKALDAEHCATQSSVVLGDILRKELGMTGVIVSDDLRMAALAGSLRDRAEASLAAGCNLLLQCGTEPGTGAWPERGFHELESLVEVADISDDTLARLEALPAPGRADATTVEEARQRIVKLLNSSHA